MGDIHLYQGQCQITHDEVRVGLYDFGEGQLGYFEWHVIGRDSRNRRIWKNMFFPGLWDWLSDKVIR